MKTHHNFKKNLKKNLPPKKNTKSLAKKKKTKALNEDKDKTIFFLKRTQTPGNKNTKPPAKKNAKTLCTETQNRLQKKKTQNSLQEKTPCEKNIRNHKTTKPFFFLKKTNSWKQITPNLLQKKKKCKKLIAQKHKTPCRKHKTHWKKKKKLQKKKRCK